MNSAFTPPIYSVTQINQLVKSLISNDPRLQYVLVRGELSNLKQQARIGHLYFSLKDENALINAVMFASNAKNINFPIDNGQEVICLAQLDVYVPRGTYQLNVIAIEQVGEGKALLQLEKLKKKLNEEGLFDTSRKRKINLYPKAIGIISAKNGAAISDILTNIKRRYPYCDIYFFPSQVQGNEASKDLLRAFNLSQKYDLDTLIIGRGGGASEDLSAFNDETLVRAVASSKMPTISAVGHEIDVTLIDLVADARASTPTGAAELSTVDRREIEQRLFDASNQIKQLLSRMYNNVIEKIDAYKNMLKTIIKNNVSLFETRLMSKKSVVESLNPRAILNRGFTITLDSEGKPLRKIEQIKRGETMTTLLKNGKIISNIKDVIKEE